MCRRLVFLALALAVAPGLLTCALAQAADAEAKAKRYGRHLAQECTSCHRLDGIDNGIPSISGWDVEAFIQTLRFYRDGARTNPVMVSVAQSLDEEQLQALALYWASLPKPAPKTPAKPKP